MSLLLLKNDFCGIFSIVADNTTKVVFSLVLQAIIPQTHISYTHSGIHILFHSLDI